MGIRADGTMDLLLLEDDPVDAMAIKRELADRYNVVSADSLTRALELLSGQSNFKPDLIVSDLNLPDSAGPDTLARLRSAAPRIPIIVTTGQLNQSLRDQLSTFGVDSVHDKNSGYGLLRALLSQSQIMHETIARYRADILSEIDSVARKAADEAVEIAIEQLGHRLGLQDEEGVRMAVRFARAADAARARFVAAIATGLAGALLLALSAGILTLIRNHGPR